MNFKNALVKSLILVAILFQGCSKKDSGTDKPEEEKPVLPVYKLKTSRPESGPGGDDYYYNSMGDIEKVETRSGDDLISVFDYIYKDGLVLSLNASAPPVPRWKDPLEPYFKHNFKYLGTQIVELRVEVFSNSKWSDNSLYTFGYDSRGFIKTKKMEYIRNDGSKVLFTFDRFTTDDRGNVTKIEEDHYSDMGVFLITTVKYREYDNKVNPFYKLLTPTRSEEYFSPNNLTKDIAFDRAGNLYPTSYEYEYNTEGYPVKQTSKFSLGAIVAVWDYYK